MAFTVSGNLSAGVLLLRRSDLFKHPPTFAGSNASASLLSHSLNRSAHVVRAKKLSSRTGRFDSRNRKGGLSTKEQVEEEEEAIESVDTVEVAFDGTPMPVLPGEEPDFWEGEKWDAFGFFVQYMWAFGVLFALVACGIAVVTYNEGATDFKDTPAYKESVQSRELLEGPDISGSDVFESNPTEEAPSLE
uniref:Uncharacterized protein n=1 Tax=Kalanchoe fedtschenkoi TaxID=63787 RepID=A0A7N0ZXI8_KALFE